MKLRWKVKSPIESITTTFTHWNTICLGNKIASNPIGYISKLGEIISYIRCTTLSSPSWEKLFRAFDVLHFPLQVVRSYFVSDILHFPLIWNLNPHVGSSLCKRRAYFSESTLNNFTKVEAKRALMLYHTMG